MCMKVALVCVLDFMDLLTYLFLYSTHLDIFYKKKQTARVFSATADLFQPTNNLFSAIKSNIANNIANNSGRLPENIFRCSSMAYTQ